MGILDDKVAIITGAGSGLGREHAKFYAAAGASVVINDMSEEGLEETAVQVRDAGGSVSINVSSVSDFAASEAMIAQAVDEFGDLDILVNNAGILRDRMSFSMSEEEFDAVIDVHLKGHWAPSRHAAVYWRGQAKAGVTKPRRLISTTSEAGLFGSAGQTNYSAAKGGILSMAIAFARELEKYEVTSNIVAPRARTGLTSYMPNMAKPDDDGAFDKYDPANVSPFMTWLASDHSAAVNGQAFIVAMNGIWLCKRWHVTGELVGERQFTIEEITERASELFDQDGSWVPPFEPPGYGPRTGVKNKA